MQDLQIRAATRADAVAIAQIYNHYIRETAVTFEEQEISDGEMASRLEAVAAASMPWLVAEQMGDVIGYAYADKWKRRSAYRYSMETTIYLDHRRTRAGIGPRLYRELLSRLPGSVHIVIGGIALPNAASVVLHERLGFEKVAHFREVGFNFGRWIDVGYWQRSQ